MKVEKVRMLKGVDEIMLSIPCGGVDGMVGRSQ